MAWSIKHHNDHQSDHQNSHKYTKIHQNTPHKTLNKYQSCIFRTISTLFDLDFPLHNIAHKPRALRRLAPLLLPHLCIQLTPPQLLTNSTSLLTSAQMTTWTFTYARATPRL